MQFIDIDFVKDKASTAERMNESVEKQASVQASWDVFLSFRSTDLELVKGIRRVLKEAGVSSYVDMLDDPRLDRANVTPATAEVLRGRILACKSLFYVATEASSQSKWMPWELGFADAAGRFPCILFVSRAPIRGQEYLGLYPQAGRRNNELVVEGRDADMLRKGQSLGTIVYKWSPGARIVI